MRPPTGQSDDRMTPFHLRLIALGAVSLLVVVALVLQMVRLSVLEGPSRLARAESRLVRRTFQPTVRGPIVDRDGRPLAVERTGWDFCVDYEVITGEWQRRQAARSAKRAFGTGWSGLSRTERDAAIDAEVPAWQARIDAVWTAAADEAGLVLAELPERLDSIRRGVSIRAASVWNRQFERLVGRRGRAEAEEIFVARPIAEQKGLHPIVEDFAVTDADAFALRKAIAALMQEVAASGGSAESAPPFAVRGVNRRVRGFTRARVGIDRATLPADLRGEGLTEIEVGGVASTLVGTTRSEVAPEDIQRRPYERRDDAGETRIDHSGYRPGRDLIGSTGLEREFDRILHGTIGMKETDRASGDVLARVRPGFGETVRIAIDTDLQARVRAILDPELGLMQVRQFHYGWNAAGPRETKLPLGTPLHGAAVVIDVRTGETLALVSTPTFSDLELAAEDLALMLMPDADAEGLPVARRDRRRALQELAPFRNRAIGTAYAPGSIVKPLVYVGGVEDGRFGLRQSIECKGWIRGEFKKPRCWGWRPEDGLYGRHGVLGPVDAIAESCNIYFYTIADVLGPDAMRAWYRACGLEMPLGSGLAGGSEGAFIPDDTEVGRMLFGIGQGSVAWTPLHAANAYARLARAGAPIEPVMVLDESSTEAGDDGDWNRAAVSIALEGMAKSAREGTASRLWLDPTTGPRTEDILDFRDLGAAAPEIWAKTGTAQVTGRASHAWYAGLIAPAGSVEPRYAFAVIVEHGNSGGRAGGPVAAQMIRALAAEGYLGEAAREALDAGPVEWLDPLPDAAAKSAPSVPREVAGASVPALERSDAG
ncbi:MAG: hypothetical protein CMJ52_11270 [Planctomycetaceae bacterium]|nr:hypothetical protein [Planctomycetaceae bacterium]